MRTYIYPVELLQEEDNRWSAWIPILPGCNSWGFSREEALENIQDALREYIAVLQEMGKPIPMDEHTQVLESSAVSVAL